MTIEGAYDGRGKMTIDKVRERISQRQASELHERGWARAAVAVVLRQIGEGLDLLLIQRSERHGDPWSGHMAFPGGRQHPSDIDLFATAARETCEEVGIDLNVHGELLGHLDELRAIGNG